MPMTDNVVEHLLVHARRCREMAGATWNEDIAAELRKLAVECTRAAREANRDSDGHTTVH